jgi:iron complex transport system substrate-binding protein
MRKTKRIISFILVMVLLASAVPLAVMPAAAISEVYEEKIPFAGEDNELTKDELVNAILPYMLGEGDLKLDDVGDAAYVYAYWSGEPKTIVDQADRTVTVLKPIERLAVTHREQFEQLRAIKVPTDIIISGERQILTMCEYKIYFAELQDRPDIGSFHRSNPELILELCPDAIIVTSARRVAAIEVFEAAGIPVICVVETERNYVENIRLLGYIFGKKDEAEEYIDWRVDRLNSIEERVENIPEEDKPKVYIEWGSWSPYSTTKEAGSRIATMGGRCIFGGEVSGTVNAEEVAKQNPDIIIIIGGCTRGGAYGGSGYSTDDVTDLKEIREKLMSREELKDVPAVKTGKVYVMSHYITGTGCCHGGRDFVQEAYLAKWFNPTYFEDFDPKAIHQEYLTRFQGLDWDLDEHGVYVYHPKEHPDGN